MRKRRAGGCLSTVILTLALIAAAVLVYIMLFAPKDGGKITAEQVLTTIGIIPKKEDGSGQSPSAQTPDDQTSDSQTPEEQSGNDPVQDDTADPSAAQDDAPDNGASSGDGEDEAPPISELPSEESIRVEITQEKLQELLEEAMSDSFPLTLDSVTISSDSTISFSGEAERDRFIELLEAQDDGKLSAYALLLKLAPEKLAFSGRVGVSYDAGKGEVSLDPKELKVAGYSIPTSLLPASLTGSMNRALTKFFAGYGKKPSGLTMYDGYMTVYFD